MPSRAQRRDPELDRLFLAFRRGDHAALEDLIARTGPWLRAVARRAGARGSEIDEVVHDAWVEASSPAAIAPRSAPLLVWLATIVQHRYAHLVRGRTRRSRLHVVDADAVANAPGDAAVDDAIAAARGREVVQLVRAAIDELDPAYRDVLRLHLFEGLLPHEVAQQLSLSRVVVRVRLFRGLRKLRARLPDALALLLVALLARPGQAAAPWLVGGAAAAAVTVGAAFALGAFADDADSGRALDVPNAANAVVASVEVGETKDSRATSPEIEPAARILEPTPRLAVLVRDEAGRPLPSAGLEIAPLLSLDAKAATRRLATDAEGRAEVRSLPAGRWRVRCDRGLERVVDLTSGPEVVELTARGGCDVEGRVLDAAGAPVPFATIWLSGASRDPLVGTDVATADAQGAFALRSLPDGARLSARSPHHARSLPVRVEAATLDLVLAIPGGSVRGVVVDERGEPVVDALVVLGAGHEGINPRVVEDQDRALPPPIAVRTDAKGAFAANGLELGAVPLVVRAAGFAAHAETVHVDDEHGAVGTAHGGDRRIALARGVVLRGRVVERGTGKPLAAQVSCRTDDVFSADAVRCGADGRFTFTALRPGRFGLVVALDDGAARDLAFDLAVGEHAIEVEVEPRAVLCGTVLAADGTPLEGWLVSARPSLASRDAHSGVQPARVDAQGEVRVAVPRGVAAADLIAHPPIGPAWLPIEGMIEPRADGGFVARIPSDALPDGRIRVIVRGANGEPLADAPVALDSGNGDGAPVGSTDANGELLVGGLPPGTYRVSVGSAHGATPPFELAGLQVRTGEETKAEYAVREPGTVEFSLRFADGRSPRAPSIVLLDRTTGRARSSHARANGTQSLLPGRYAMVAAGDDFVVVTDLEFEVHARETVHVERILRPASRRLLSLRELPEGCRSGAFVGRCIDAETGESLGRFDVRLDAGAPLPLMAILPTGRIRVEATVGEARQRVEAALELVDLRDDLVAQRVPFSTGPFSTRR